MRLTDLIPETFDISWMADGRCVDANPDDFFPEDGRSTRRAKKLCEQCPVTDDCLAFALNLSSHEDFGVWGGTSELERRKIRAGELTVEEARARAGKVRAGSSRGTKQERDRQDANRAAAIAAAYEELRQNCRDSVAAERTAARFGVSKRHVYRVAKRQRAESN